MGSSGLQHTHRELALRLPRQIQRLPMVLRIILKYPGKELAPRYIYDLASASLLLLEVLRSDATFF